MPTLEALSTATPEHRVEQPEIRAVAEGFLEDVAPEHLDLLDVFDSAGIDARSLSRPFDWYLSGPGWSERSRAFEDVGTDLAEAVTVGALEDRGLPVSAVDGVLLVNTTGLATPSLDALLVDRLGLRPDVERVPIWGLGCAGGAAGLARASDLARANPGNRYLLVSLELCSLAFLQEDLSKRMIVAAALFGDGCAGALVAGDDLDVDGPRIEASASHKWPDTQGVMGWEVADEGLGVVMSRRIPEIVADELGPVARSFCKRSGTTLEETRPVLHPGGPKVLEAYQDGLGLDPEALSVSRKILREHGNMSSPTVLFALQESLRRAPLGEGDQALVGAVGPGFAAELALLRGS